MINSRASQHPPILIIVPDVSHMRKTLVCTCLGKMSVPQFNYNITSCRWLTPMACLAHPPNSKSRDRLDLSKVTEQVFGETCEWPPSGKTQVPYRISFEIVSQPWWIVYAACKGKRADNLDIAPEARFQDFDGLEITGQYRLIGLCDISHSGVCVYTPYTPGCLIGALGLLGQCCT
jgi:hypothetical protein